MTTEREPTRYFKTTELGKSALKYIEEEKRKSRTKGIEAMRKKALRFIDIMLTNTIEGSDDREALLALKQKIKEAKP